MKNSALKILGCTCFRDNKHTNAFHADRPGVYTSEKVINLGTINKTHPKYGFFNGSIVDGGRKPSLFSFVLVETPGYKVICELETFHWKEKNKSVLNTITIYLEDDRRKKVSFNGKTSTFSLQLIKI